MMSMNSQNTINPCPGDWVESASPGIWQVLSVMMDFYETRFYLQDQKRLSRHPVVFAKRLVDDRWKRAFAVESCSISLVHPLTPELAARLSAFLASNPGILPDFEAFQPQLPGLVISFGFYLPHVPHLDDRRALVTSAFEGIERGFTNDEILERIAASTLAPYQQAAPTNTTVRFGNRKHELRDKQFVYRGFDVLPF
jgi:hypothetical protein